MLDGQATEDDTSGPAAGGPRRPPPTAASPYPPELIHDRDDAIAISTSPDICKTPVGSSMVAVPYPVTGFAGQDSNYTSTVFSNGLVVKHAGSCFSKTVGDEPGQGKGVKSGTVGGIVEPTSSSPIVRVQGQPIIRHADTCTLNNGNCPGEYVHVKSVATAPAPDGKDEDERSALDKFWGQAKNKSGTLDTADRWVNDPSQIGQDAQSAWDAVPSWDEAVQGAKDIGGGIASGAKQVWDDPVGTGGKVVDWGADQAVGAWEEGKRVYGEDGLAGVAGAAVGTGVEVFGVSRKAKLLDDAADGLGDMGRATRRRDDDEPEREEEDGEAGARSTALIHRVKCFDMPPGMDPKEYDRQLAEQMQAINNMTADEMAYAHWVLDKAGSTKLLRDPTAQARHRAEYSQMLMRRGLSRAEVAQRMSGTHATHFLDMVAGGDPRGYSRDAAGNPILGAGDVNSHIGSQWSQEGRAKSLGEEAERMRNDGKHGDKMNVELGRCKLTS